MNAPRRARAAKPAPRIAAAPPVREPVRREYSDADQAEIQQSALVAHFRRQGIQVHAYELDGVMRFERIGDVVPMRAKR